MNLYNFIYFIGFCYLDICLVQTNSGLDLCDDKETRCLNKKYDVWFHKFSNFAQHDSEPKHPNCHKLTLVLSERPCYRNKSDIKIINSWSLIKSQKSTINILAPT